MTASPKKQKAKPKAKKGKKPRQADRKKSERSTAAAQKLETAESEGWFKTAVARIFRAKV
jgi:hypothetical protein